MTSTQRAESVAASAMPGTGGGAQTVTAAAPRAFKIRWGRLALALAGLLSLLAGVVSTLLLLFGVGSGWLPMAGLLGAVAAVALLRRLAVRDRRRKMNAAFRAAMGGGPEPTPARPSLPAPTPTPPADQPVVRPESPLFDAEADRALPEPAPKPLTALDLREAALAEAAASGDASAAGTGIPTAAEGSSWEPVDVPKPTYVEAAKAERAAPMPLDLPEAPKAVGKPSLKQASAVQASAVPAADSRPADDSDEKSLSKAQSVLGNLDDVLQRRRA